MARKIKLDKRSRQILQAVVAYHINTAEPVGSRTISRKYNFNLSPATIRNIMADLEEMGYLQHPHTSAGRLPTELGYRIYIECLNAAPAEGCQLLSKEERKKFAEFDEIDKLLRYTCKILSSTTNYIGIVLAPKMTRMIFKHISFVQIRSNTVMVIFVSDSGLVQQNIIRLQKEYSQEKLDKMANLLNKKFKNISLLEVRRNLLEMIRQDQITYDELLFRALKLEDEILESQEDAKIFIDGHLNIFSEPEFNDLNKMKAIFETFEEKNQLLNILDSCIKDGGIQILIGSENQIAEMRDCSLVTSVYVAGNFIRGTLGVIGPTRMNYSAVIPQVEYTASLVSQTLSNV